MSIDPLKDLFEYCKTQFFQGFVTINKLTMNMNSKTVGFVIII